MHELLTLAERARLVIKENTPSRGRFRKLSQDSGIAEDSWKSFWYGRQRPTEEMLSHVFSEWPDMAFWLATGLTDAVGGHIAPPGAPALDVAQAS